MLARPVGKRLGTCRSNRVPPLAHNAVERYESIDPKSSIEIPRMKLPMFVDINIHTGLNAAKRLRRCQPIGREPKLPFSAYLPLMLDDIGYPLM